MSTVNDREGSNTQNEAHSEAPESVGTNVSEENACGGITVSSLKPEEKVQAMPDTAVSIAIN